MKLSPPLTIDGNQHHRHQSLLRRVLNRLQRQRWYSCIPCIRQKVLALALALLVVLSTVSGVNAAAVTSGRSGGSFSPSSSSRSSHSSSSSFSSSSSSRFTNSFSSRPASPVMQQRKNNKWNSAPAATPSLLPPQIRIYRDSPPVITVFTRPSRTRVVHTTTRSIGDATTPATTSFRPSDILILTGTGTLLAYGFRNNYRQQQQQQQGHNSRRSGPLGPGATVATVTVAMQVPQRSDGSNDILSKIRHYSDQADTTTRKGVQKLVSQAALEVLRQEKYVVSASTRYSHFPTPELAQREFQQQSIQNRAKFDREAVNKFGDEVYSEERAPRPPTAVDYEATMAIVILHMAVEGDSTQLPAIRFRKDLQTALARISADAQVGECLLSAEILWAPEESFEVLTMDDVYADYPELIPL